MVHALSMSDNEYRTPGQLVEAILKTNGWTMRVLAVVLGCDETSINRIVNGKRPVDAQMALALGEVLGVAPERFLDLQKSYELAQARIVTRPDPDRATRAHLFGGLPISEMIKRRWINADDVRNVPKVETALTRFFGVASLDEIEILPHAAKKTDVAGEATPAQLAWLYRVRQIASEALVPKYSEDAVSAAIPKLRSLLANPDEARHVPRILMECGIRYVIVETIGDAKIDGVCFWIDDDRPVIGMSTRYDRMDNFWFVLRHELEHLVRRHGYRPNQSWTVMLDADDDFLGADIDEQEQQANEAAADFCVPTDKMKLYIKHKSPFFSERDLIGFARTLGIHPALVAGQLGHKTKRPDRFRQYLVKVRSVVLPNAMVDGWGNVYPVEE